MTGLCPQFSFRHLKGDSFQKNPIFSTPIVLFCTIFIIFVRPWDKRSSQRARKEIRTFNLDQLNIHNNKMYRLILLISALTFMGNHASPQTAQPIDTIPFVIGTDQRMYVQGYVEGVDTVCRFLVDTGATDVVVNSQSPVMKALSAHFTLTAENNSANSTEAFPYTPPVMNVRLRHTVVDSLSLLAIPYPPEAWDGVLGLSWLSRFTVRIDYKQKWIVLYRPGTYQPLPEALCLPMEIDRNLGIPVVPLRVRVDNVDCEVRAAVDTGSDRVLDLCTAFVERHHLLGTQHPFAISSVTGTATTGGRLENVYFRSVSFGRLTLPRIPGAFSTLQSGVQAGQYVDAILGNNLLHRFNQTYDFANGCLYLEVNDLLYTPFYDFLAQ